MNQKISVKQDVEKVGDNGKVIGVEININCSDSGSDPGTEHHIRAETDVGNYRMNFQEKADFVNALLECATMKDRDTRNAILNDMPTDIRNTIQRHTANLVDVNNIVARCLDFTGGIKKLTDILRGYEGNAVGMQKVDSLLSGFLVSP